MHTLQCGTELVEQYVQVCRYLHGNDVRSLTVEWKQHRRICTVKILSGDPHRPLLR